MRALLQRFPNGYDDFQEPGGDKAQSQAVFQAVEA